jgi:2Fe-2S ferredoxin
MPKIIILPHDEICPDGAQFDAEAGISVLDAALEHGVAIDHACEKSCACTTCHIYVREGYDSLAPPNDNEDDYLDKAWGLDPDSRLGCQAIIADEDLVIEIPKYTVNLVSEHH